MAGSTVRGPIAVDPADLGGQVPIAALSARSCTANGGGALSIGVAQNDALAAKTGLASGAVAVRVAQAGMLLRAGTYAAYADTEAEKGEWTCSAHCKTIARPRADTILPGLEL